MITTAPNTDQDREATASAQTPAQPKEQFRITDEGSANWLLKKLAGIEAERALIKAQAKKRDEELQADYNALMGSYGDDLRAWAREEANRRRRQGVTLMYGTLAFRAKSAQLVIASEPDAITTAKLVCPAAVVTETVEKFDKEAYLQYAQARFDADGELLPGIDRTPEGETFSVSVKAKE